MENNKSNLSIILPAKNEEEGLSKLLPSLVELYPNAEIIIVNDGSTDGTINLCEKFGVKIINHPYSKGNGAAVKSGARYATGEILVFMDADGQHNPEHISLLLDEMGDEYDMVVGARGRGSQANAGRLVANSFYNFFSSLIVGHKVYDLTSGFRVVKADKFREFLHLLPNGFSYPTTITMAFFRAGYSIKYKIIDVKQRIGKSHIRPVKDGVRFLIIIFRIGTLYSPLKLFIPISACFFGFGIIYYLYNFILYHRFTNMSVLLFSTSIVIFLIGLLSEQITNLAYMSSSKE